MVIFLLLSELVLTGCKLKNDYDDPIVAQVERKKLYLSEVEKILGPSPSSQSFDQLISLWVEEQLWYHDAKRFVKTDKEIQDLVKKYEESLLIRKYQETYLHDQSVITDKDIQDYYQEHLSEFITPRPAAFIELHSLNSKKSADEVIASIKASGYSNTPSKVQLVYKNDYIEDLDNAIFLKSTNTLLGPIKVNDTYYVINILEKYSENSTLALEHVRDDIIQKLRIDAFSKARQKKYKELKDQYNVKIFQNTDN